MSETKDETRTISVREKLEAGCYRTTLEYPDRVTEPLVLKKLARDLTEEEAAALPATRAAFKAEQEAAKAARQAYDENTSRLEALLVTDLEAEHGMTGHPKASALWGKAWENGHSGGLGEVICVYEDLIDLVK